MSKDRITLTVPARSEYARTVRLAAAELAARIGMSYDEVDDMRIAAEEAFVYACECSGAQTEITFTFIIDGGTLTTEVGPLPECCTAEGLRSRSESYSEFILQSVCDEYSIEHEAGACMLRLVRRSAVATGNAGA
jgi:serine/threonine-protein kinase RsbW